MKFIIRPSIAHRLAELLEEAQNDNIEAQLFPVMAGVYARIRKAVFEGANRCHFEIDDYILLQKTRAILKKQGFKVYKSSLGIRIIWKKSWIQTIMKHHNNEQI